MREADKPTLTIQLNQPAFRIKLGKEMSINKKVLRTLGNPEHILFWWNKSKRVLFIGTSLDETPLSFRIGPSYYNSRTIFKIRKRRFIQELMKLSKWQYNMIYAVCGEYISELNMVAFKLDKAQTTTT